MARKRFELDDNVARLVDRYSEDSNEDFDKIVNDALKYYLVTKLGSRESRELLKHKDRGADSKYIDEMFNSNLRNTWNI